jgi:hypothetical protein
VAASASASGLNVNSTLEKVAYGWWIIGDFNRRFFIAYLETKREAMMPLALENGNV